MIDRHPALVGRPTDEEGVAALVNLARERGLTLAVRCGGHSVSGHGTCEGGIVIDLSGLNSIEVDPEAKLATAGGGTTWGELDAATQEHGLAVTGGRVSNTGIGGLTLGSGSGWLERAFGLTCDSLTSARVVLADGSIVTASPFQNEDLFWGLRGGGGNFGVVTQFTYELHELGPLVLGGMLLYPREMAPELSRFYRDFIEAAPDEVGGGLAFISAPPHDPVPVEVQGKPMVGVIVVYAGGIKEGEDALRPLMEFGPPAMAMVQPMPYTAVQMMLNDAFPEVLFEPMGGAIARVSPDATALSVRDVKWCYHTLTIWLPEMGPDEVHVGWTKKLAEAMSKYARPGVYLNYVADEGQERVISSYGPHYERLVELKNRYDPQNLFSVNQNIRPTA
jgi:FAD/FMN-containing dehydrogenase